MKRILTIGLFFCLAGCHNSATTQPTDQDKTTNNDTSSIKADTVGKDSIRRSGNSISKDTAQH